MSVRRWWVEYGPRSVLVPVMVASVALGSVTACGGSDSGASPSTSTAAGGAASPAASAEPAAVGATVSADEVAAGARARVFFGHQSVGGNVLSGLPRVFTAHNVPAPPVEEGTAHQGHAGGFVAHAFVGENEKPVSKIRDFDARLRSGLGGQVNVAMMKFCYVDVTRDTDVNALFTQYRDTLRALERDFPNVRFVAVTVPLTTARSGSEADNVNREQLNALIRGEYSGRRLFDLALVESTAPDGARVSGTYQGKQFFALHEGYAADEGHLNSTGSERAASAWLHTVAQAAAG